MRFTAATAALPLLILLLTWMALRSFNDPAEQFDRSLTELQHLAMQEAALQRDVLSARAGILRTYDPLVAEVNALRASIGHLRAVGDGWPEAAPILNEIDSKVVEEEHSVERFKTDNALLQNSLSYFARFSRSFANDPLLSEQLSALASAMLRLTLNTSVESRQAVRDALDQLAGRPGLGQPVLALLAHGRLLSDLLPQADQTISALFAGSLRRDQAMFRAVALKRQAASRAAARRSKTALYATSLLLVLLLTYLGAQLQERARATRRRAAFELVIADASVRLIRAGPQELPDVVVQALAAMARCVGAERAYFLGTGFAFTWSAPGAAFPPDWPVRAPSLALRLGADKRDGALQIPRTDRVRSAEDRAALLVARLQGWACVLRAAKDDSPLLLGFDSVTHPCRITAGGELGLLPMGLDAIVNALTRRAIEQERMRLEVRLQQARRLETVGALTGGITHNFNNILGAILGYTEIAEEADLDIARYAEILQEIRTAGERAREVVDQVLTLARPHDAPPQRICLQTLISESVSFLSASLPRAVTLEITTSPKVALFGRPAQLQQVILNLCTNAAQAMANAGVITLDVAEKQVTAERPLSHGTLHPGHYVCIAVADRGHGIERATLDRMFEPFFTTRGTGIGLGLATVREIVAEHRGALQVQSTVGVGTTIEVWLPTFLDAPAMRDEPQVQQPGNGETILLVEHDSARRLHDEELLAALGFEPVGFQQAGDAEQAYRTDPGRFDAVIIGYIGSTAETLRLSAALRGHEPSVPIVLAAPYLEFLSADALTDAGVSDVVHRPISAAELLSSLKGRLPRRARADTASGPEESG